MKQTQCRVPVWLIQCGSANALYLASIETHKGGRVMPRRAAERGFPVVQDNKQLETVGVPSRSRLTAPGKPSRAGSESESCALPANCQASYLDVHSDRSHTASQNLFRFYASLPEISH